jgi:phosphoserine phosphatase RsbU/P
VSGAAGGRGALDESLDDLYENAPCGYLSTLPDGTVARVNRTLLDWTGHDRAAVVGRPFADLLSPGGRIYHETHYAPLLQMQGSVREIAFEIVRADGSRLPVLVNSTVRRDAGGDPVAIRTTIFDATDRREYERELLRARDREQEARERAEVMEQTMARLAEENAALYERERGIARTLQNSLLAGDPPRDPRMGIAAHYAPAGEGTLEVGGDWHDAIRLDADRVGLAVGDVVGRGIDAAATMGQLRSAVRALAGIDLPPARLLDQLDVFAERVESAWMATLAFADVDLATGRLRYACAGHLPPLLLPPDEPPRLLWDGRSVPLGAREHGAPARPEGELALPAGARLIVFTDGLVERNDRPIDDGLARLLEVAADLRALPLDRLAVELPRALAADGRGDDDVCLLALALARGQPSG